MNILPLCHLSAGGVLSGKCFPTRILLWLSAVVGLACSIF